MPLSSPSTRRRLLEVGVIIAGLALTGGLVAAVSWPTVNDVTTGATPEYPELRPQVLRFSPELVLARAAETVDDLDGWRLVEVDEAAGAVHAEAETSVWGFVDDVTIDVEAYGGGSLVTVRSRSRVGRSDFGQNARNIQRLQAALSTHLELARPAR